MQRSGIFVVFCDVPKYDTPTEAQGKPAVDRVYHATFGSTETTPRMMRIADDQYPVTSKLVEAMQADKRTAFQTAVRMGGAWSAGELISDGNGIRVEV